MEEIFYILTNPYDEIEIHLDKVVITDKDEEFINSNMPWEYYSDSVKTDEIAERHQRFSQAIILYPEQLHKLKEKIVELIDV